MAYAAADAAAAFASEKKLFAWRHTTPHAQE